MSTRDQEQFRPATPDGTDLRVAVSALVKNLRQGREVEGLYWANQIEQGGFWKYLFRRFATFATEDIGLADPHAIVTVQAVRSAYEQARTESRSPRPDPSLVGLAVMVLSRAPKSREASELAQAVIHLQQDEGWTASVPDEAYDLHTEVGRVAMDRTQRLTHWLNVASQSVTTGPLDWTLWIRRWAVRRGALDRAEVEAQAERWNAEGRLLYGLDGYRPRGGET